MSTEDEYLARIRTLEKANRVLQRKLERTRTDLIKLEDTNDKKEFLLRTVIEDLNQSERQLQSLMEGTASTVGQDFFPALVKYIAEALTVSYAVVSERCGDQLRTLGMWAKGTLQPNIVNPFVHTPCEQVFQHGIYVCAQGVQQEFPNAHLLAEFGAESYLGIALRDAEGHIIGDLYIIDEHPLHNVTRAQQILSIFAMRAAVELERQRTNDALCQLNQKLDATVKERTTELCRSEARMRTVVEALPDLLLRVTRDGTCIDSVYSPNLASDFYPIAQNHLSDVLPPALLEQQLDAIEQALMTQTIQIYEHELERNGKLVPEEIRVAAISSDEALIIVRNISDRKQAEASLRESEERYASLASIAPVGIFRTDAAGHCIYVNKRWCQIAGLTLEEAAGEGWVKGLHPDDRDRVAAEWYHAAQENRPLKLECRFQRSDGVVTWVYAQSVAELDSNKQVTGYVGTITDISERKQFEIERLQAEQTRKELRILEQILDTSFAGYWDWDILHQRDYLSPGLKRMFGYGDHELPDSSESLKELIFSEDLPRVMTSFDRHVQSRGKLPYRCEIRCHHKDGSAVWVICSGQVIEWDDDGNPLRMVGCRIDISDRKQLELSVHTAQQKLSQVLDTAIAGIIRLRLYADMSIQYDYISPHCEKIFGYRVDDFVEHANLWRSRLDPHDWEHVITPTLQSILEHRDTSTHRVEYRFKHNDQSICWVLANIFAQWNESGHYWNVTIVDTDISDRKQIENALRESETRWQFALEGAGDGVWDWDAHKNSVFYSHQWKAMLGYADHDVGDTVEEWESRIHPADRDRCYVSLYRHFSGETPIYQSEHRIRCKDGSYKWILARGKVIESTPEGSPLRVIGTHTDTTERKLAEQKIREQAELLDIASDAIIVRDLDQHILYWNRGAERLYGWKSVEAIGRKADELLQANVLIQMNGSQIEMIMRSLLEQGEWKGELNKVTQSGQNVIVEGRWTLVRDETEQPKYILSVDTNITERKQLEIQFYQAQRLESLGCVASGIAHDLNNVLTPILTMTQLLRLTQKSLSEKAQEQLKLLEESAQRGANMVKQILTFTRGSTGERVAVSLVPLVREVVSIAQRSFPKTIDIRYCFPDEDSAEQSFGVVSADPTHLHQVFMNLCINARDGMPNGGVLTLSSKVVFVDEAEANANLDVLVGWYVVVTITDTGVGIIPEVRDRMFEPFFTTKEIGKGTGLGLSTALGIVKNHGGFLQISSKVGKGTDVNVYLPTVNEIPTNHHFVDERIDGHGELILIVDDEEAIRRSTQSLLENHHYTTLVAKDGLDADSLVRNDKGDIRVAIVDVMMPNMDGISLIRKLKEMKPMLRIIAISGLPTNRRPVLAAGADAFLSKPYVLEQLMRKLSELTSE
ncbi:MAG: PAS domain S-box protein [Cyanobacteria bacterium P01_A01_bin.37]